MTLPATERTSDPALNAVLALREHCSDRDLTVATATLGIRRGMFTAQELAAEVARVRALRPISRR
jgi:hypothetical protein